MVRPHLSGGGVPAPTPEQLLTAFGFSVFPVSGKRPKGEWSAYQTARAPIETLQRWQESGSDYAIATGPISGVVVVDTDTQEAEEWAEANLPPTPWVVLTGVKDPVTGWRGRHRYYRSPSPPDSPTRNRTNIEVGPLRRKVVTTDDGKQKSIGTGLDLRGQGGYVVAPGSSHPSGVRYEVTNEWFPADKVALPVFNLAWFDAPAQEAIKAPAVPFKDNTPTSSAFERAAKWLSKKDVPYEGERNHVCYSAACSLFDFGLSLSDVEGLIHKWNRSFPSPLPEDEVRRTVASAETSRQPPQHPKGAKVGTVTNRQSSEGTRPELSSINLPTPADEESEGGKSQFDILMEVCEVQFPFFFNDGTAYLSPGESLAIPLESKKAEQYIRHRFYKETGKAVSTENVSKLIAIKTAELSIEGPVLPVFRRVGRVDDTYFLDLCQNGKVVRMTASGWEVTQEQTEVYFIRNGSEEEALPVPEPGGNVLKLSEVVNVSESSLKLLLAYLVAALRPGFPFVVLVLEGEAGSGKSSLARVLKYLIDPTKELIRAMPGQERDFAVYAHNSHLLALDNLDRITPGQSDMLCRAATGGGFASRTHYSMTDETVISIQRPVILTGIQGLVDRADMADRVALVQLERVADQERIPEAELWPIVERIRPQVLGGLLDAFCAGLKSLDSVKLDRLPRMADFAKFTTAAETGFPWTQGEALAAFQQTRENLFEQALEKDVVALAVLEFLEDRRAFGQGEWEGTSSDLLAVLTPPTGLEDRWPRKGSKLGKRLAKAAPLLREKGVVISSRRTGKGRFITLALKSVSAKASFLSLTSQTPISSRSECDKTSDSSKNGPSPNCHSPGRVTKTSHPKTETSPELSHSEPRGYGKSDESDGNDNSAGTFFIGHPSEDELPEGWESGII